MLRLYAESHIAKRCYVKCHYMECYGANIITHCKMTQHNIKTNILLSVAI
jgi:hypothetical protein